MKHDEINIDLIQKFFARETSLKEERKIEHWINKSEDNRLLFARERKFFDALQLADNKTLDISQLHINTKSNIWVHVNKLLKIAALVVITFGISWSYYFFRENNDNLVATVPMGHRVNIKLTDGSNVWLNGKTIMAYPASFKSGKRVVEIDGEAYFEVVKDKKPFIVKSSKGVVEVVGTTFNIKDFSDSKEYEVALINGSVNVHLVEDPDNTVAIKPGYFVSLQHGKLLQPKKIEDYDVFRWRDGLICFKDATFDTIIESLEESFGIEVQVVNFEYGNLRYTGKFRQEDGIDYALRVMQKNLDFEFERDIDSKVIYIK